MANKFAHFRGQRYSVVKEGEKYVTLEGYGFQKNILKDEVIFEDVPEDELNDTVKDTIDIIPPLDHVEELPSERREKDLHDQVKNEEKLRGTETDEDLIDQDPVWAAKERAAKEKSKQKPNSQALSVATKSTQNLVGAMEEVKIPVIPGTDHYQTPSPLEATGSTSHPNYPKIGIDTSIFSQDDRHAENAKRTQAALSNFKSKIQEMLKELEESEMDEAGTTTGGIAGFAAPLGIGTTKRPLNDETQEGVGMPYETFDSFLKDFMIAAKQDGAVSDKHIDIENALKDFCHDKFAVEFVKKLGGFNKVVEILGKKAAEMGLEVGEVAMAEDSLPPITAPAGSAMPANDDDAQLQSKLGGPISPAVKKIEENGGTTSVAGAGCADGTVNPSVIGLQGVAQYAAPLGPIQKRLNKKP